MIPYMVPMGFVFVPVTSVNMKLVEVVLAYMCICFALQGSQRNDVATIRRVH